jgi:hypothetical protein
MNWIKQFFSKKETDKQCDIHTAKNSFFYKTKQLGLIKTIKLFKLVYKIKKSDKKNGNISVGYYSMFDTTTGN